MNHSRIGNAGNSAGDCVTTLPEQPFPSELVLENAIVGVCYMIERRFIWANSRMASIFGYEDGELNGQPVRKLYLNEEDYQAVGNMYATFAQNDTYSHERAMVRKDGSLIWCLIAGRMIDASDPRSPSVWVVQDITPRKEAEDQLKRTNQRLEQIVERRTLTLRRSNEALHDEAERRRTVQAALLESREKYRALFRHIPLGVLFTNAEGEIVEINRTIQSFTGARTKSELAQLVQDAERVVEADGSSISLAEFVRRHTPRDGRRVERCAMTWRSVSGKLREYSIVASALAVHDLGAIVTFEDVTEARLASKREHEQQMALAQASRLSLMGQMNSALAHELGQPLNACQSYVSGIRHRLGEELKDRPELLEALDKISTHLDRAGDIIRNVRGFVAQHQPKFEAIDLVALLRQTLSLLDMQIRTGEVGLDLEFEEEAICVQANSVEIQQVIINLIVNALDALAGLPQPERKIMIRLGQDQRGKAYLQVSDNGPGVPNELLGKIFTSYLSTKSTGLGMGLMICRSVIESHGGTIRYLPGKPVGACFRFTLPIGGSA
ncbi:MAG: PAS domain S-box protein [Betaproteobacteria bacterium]|nr:PAS domain S-box protein [Betaproteobacteria bacterium]